MIFAPVIRRAAYAANPLAADLALQRFLLGQLGQAAQTTPATAPAGCEITQDDKATTLQLDVPGLAREQLQLTLDGKRVTLQSVEGAPRTVQRVWELPHDIDLQGSSARLEHGVLTLTLARPAPQSQATTLTIQ